MYVLYCLVITTLFSFQAVGFLTGCLPCPQSSTSMRPTDSVEAPCCSGQICTCTERLVLAEAGKKPSIKTRCLLSFPVLPYLSQNKVYLADKRPLNTLDFAFTPLYLRTKTLLI